MSGINDLHVFTPQSVDLLKDDEAFRLSRNFNRLLSARQIVALKPLRG